MEAKSLRIGNWVKRSTQPGGFQIESHSFVVCERDPSMYEPIPLTEDWLLKMGFRKSEDFILTLGPCKDLSYSPTLKEMYLTYGQFAEMSETVPCKYVHQVQNLIHALTNTELTINL